MKERLTAREWQIIDLWCKQLLKIPAIATELKISIKTVEKHIQNLYKSLYVHSKEECIVRCLQLGLVKIEEIKMTEIMQ